jgi:hypothetical protein
MNMRFGTWKIWSLNRVGSLMRVARELSRYTLDLVEVQEVRWDGNGTEPAGKYTFFMERRIRTMNWVQFFVHKKIILAIKRVEFVSDRMLYIILRGRWFHIIVLNVHAQIKDKIDNIEDSSYEELECIFDKFPKYHMNILFIFKCQSRQRRHF